MFMMNYNFMYLIILMIFSIFTISLNSLFFTWMLMELNLLMVIPLLFTKTSFMKEQTSLPMKYFLIQVLGSILLLISLISMDMGFLSLSKMNFLFLISLMMKSGMPPLHFWFPWALNKSNYIQAFILLCVQKIIPIFLIGMILTEKIIIFIVLSSVLGGLLGLNQNSIMKILAYSSMTHSSWMISGLMSNFISMILYFLIYVLVSFPLLLSLNYYNVKYISDLISLNKWMLFSLSFIMTVLTLSGTPPFIGFFIKIFIIKSLMNSNFFFIIFFLILGSTLSFYYYLRVMISLTVFYSAQLKEKTNLNLNKNYFFYLLMINFMYLLTLMFISQ